jgi:hypothetical protein
VEELSTSKHHLYLHFYQSPLAWFPAFKAADTFSITRDNASSNDTLLKAFINHYNKEAIKFQGDIPCITHVLNLIIQDILKGLIKNDYDASYIKDIYISELAENEEEELLEQGTSKSPY